MQVRIRRPLCWLGAICCLSTLGICSSGRSDWGYGKDTSVGIVVDVGWDEVSELAGALDILTYDRATRGGGSGGIIVSRYSLAVPNDLGRLIKALQECKHSVLLFKGCWNGRGA